MTEAQQLEAAQKRNAEIREQKFETLRNEDPWDTHDRERWRFLLALQPDLIYGPFGLIDVKNNGGNLRGAIDTYRNSVGEKSHV